MTPPPTDEFEKLRLLQEAADVGLVCGCAFSPHGNNFYRAAHAALGPEGCVTRELETARLAYQNLFQNATRYEIERDALKDEVKRLREALRTAQGEIEDLHAELLDEDRPF